MLPCKDTVLCIPKHQYYRFSSQFRGFLGCNYYHRYDIISSFLIFSGMKIIYNWASALTKILLESIDVVLGFGYFVL